MCAEHRPASSNQHRPGSASTGVGNPPALMCHVPCYHAIMPSCHTTMMHMHTLIPIRYTRIDTASSSHHICQSECGMMAGSKRHTALTGVWICCPCKTCNTSHWTLDLSCPVFRHYTVLLRQTSPRVSQAPWPLERLVDQRACYRPTDTDGRRPATATCATPTSTHIYIVHRPDYWRRRSM